MLLSKWQLLTLLLDFPPTVDLGGPTAPLLYSPKKYRFSLLPVNSFCTKRNLEFSCLINVRNKITITVSGNGKPKCFSNILGMYFTRGSGKQSEYASNFQSFFLTSFFFCHLLHADCLPCPNKLKVCVDTSCSAS